MFLNSSSSIPLVRQKGLGLPTALFMIVVMMLIVTGINQINELNANAYGREWLSMRAFYMAESGAQSAVVYALNPSQAMPTCDAGFIPSVAPGVQGLMSCSASVQCDAHIVGSDTYYTFTSTGQCGPGADEAVRIVQVRIKL